MLFSSLAFLYWFLPAVLAAFLLVPRGWRNAVLFASSLFFYFYGEPVYTLLLLFSSVSDYLHSLYIEGRRGTPAARRALVSSVVINLAMLGVFKYADFFIGTVNGLLGTSIPLTHLPLPLGISFFTFQTMSYTIDVYRGRARAERSIVSFATYVCLFPQLVAGPIVRYVDVDRRLRDPGTTAEGFAFGARRFSVGLAKKVLIANVAGECVEALAAAPLSGAGALVSGIAFCVQIYFDFSGYSDMAIGLGRMFGFDFPENFNYPYISRSVTEFWRRWHMTLSFWFRDYLYIPLGGNRKGRGRMVLNILIVWAATGLWHGAQWNFVLWGLYYGVLLLVEKLLIGKSVERAPRAVQHAYALVITLVGFVIFSSHSAQGALTQLAAMVGIGAPWTNAESLYCIGSYAVVLAVGAVGSTPLPAMAGRRLAERFPKVMAVAEPVFCGLLMLLCTALLVDGAFNPFLYFRF